MAWLTQTRGLLFVLWKRTELSANTHKSFGSPAAPPSHTHSGPHSKVLPWEVVPQRWWSLEGKA